MFGGGSIQLGRVFGIRIGVDVSWFFVLFLIIWSFSGYYGDLFPGEDGKAFALATVTALLFFLSILLHELWHALVAIRNGIPISGIDLRMFGGVAKLERDTDSPGVEFRVAVAGPLVTLAIAVVCFGAAVALSGSDAAENASTFQVGNFDEATAVLGHLAAINLFVLLFNLIPGFPLDGGRIARAIAWKLTGDRNRATRLAARLGRAAAYLMIGLGVVMFLTGDAVGGLWLGFIGLFLSQAARSAEVQAAFAGRIEGLRVADVMDGEPVSVPAELKLDRLFDEYFLRYGYPWFPVVDAGGKFIGVVIRQRAENVPEQIRATSSVDEVTQFDLGHAHAVPLDAPLESLLASEGLQALGAMMAVDRDGILRGVVTIDQVRRALRPSEPVA